IPESQPDSRILRRQAAEAVMERIGVSSDSLQRARQGTTSVRGTGDNGITYTPACLETRALNPVRLMARRRAQLRAGHGKTDRRSRERLDPQNARPPR